MRLKNILKFSNKFSPQGGFTLIELLVVFFVSSVVATVVMTNFGDFTSETEFENEALNIALTIREAQVYGLSGKEVEADFGVTYGVVFSDSEPNSFTLNTFRDQDTNYIFYTLNEVNVEETFLIKDGFRIVDVCFDSDCEFYGAGFMFERPNPDADMYVLISEGGGFLDSGYSNGSVVLERISDGSTKTINITDTGQIYVN